MALKKIDMRVSGLTGSLLRDGEVKLQMERPELLLLNEQLQKRNAELEGEVATLQKEISELQQVVEIAEQLQELLQKKNAEIEELVSLVEQLQSKQGEEAAEETALFQTVGIPNLKFADVAGMDEVKKKFREMVIEPLKHPELAEKFGVKRGGGVLLYGPPGTGKTFMARALAGELNASFYVIKSSDLVSKYVGGTEERIKQLFAEAHKNPLAVIFIDEIDAIIPDRTREDMKVYDNMMVNALLQEIDGFESKDSKSVLLVLGATNRPYYIDSAFLRPGRFDVKIRVDLPDFDCRCKLLELFFKSRKCTLPENLLRDAAKRTEGFNSADVENLAQIVVSQAFQEEIKFRETHSKDAAYTPDFKKLFEEAFKTAKSSVSRRDLDLLAQWERENGII